MITAIDIETTGLTAADEITVVGFGNAEKFIINYNTDGGRIDVDHEDFAWESASGDTDPDISLRRWPSEERLLTRLGQSVHELNLDREGELMVGFNVERFDFQMLRTRSMVHGTPWVFDGTACIDIQNTLRYDCRTKASDAMGFNKSPMTNFAQHIGLDVDHGMNKYEVAPLVRKASYDSEDVKEFCTEEDVDEPTETYDTMDGIHQLYVDLGIIDESPYDPLDGDSGKCVQKWQEGDMVPIIKHNLSDLVMTLNLVGLLEEYTHDGDLEVLRL